jgi:hypothetical protein
MVASVQSQKSQYQLESGQSPSVTLSEVSSANEVEAALAVLSVAKKLRPRRDPSLRSGRPKRPSRTAAELARRHEDQREEGSSSRFRVKPVPDSGFAKRSVANGAVTNL